MAGQLTIDTLRASSGVLATQNGMTGIAKAWVQFNGTNGTIASSFNVSSVTYNGTGDYSVNFTTAIGNSTYAVSTVGTNVSGSSYLNFMTTDTSNLPTSSVCRLACVPAAGGNPRANPTQVYCAIFSA